MERQWGGGDSREDLTDTKNMSLKICRGEYGQKGSRESRGEVGMQIGRRNGKSWESEATYMENVGQERII